MHICRFNRDRLGVVEGDTVFDVSAALDVLPKPAWPYPKGDPLLVHFDALRDAIERAKPSAPSCAVGDVALSSPITAPSKVMAAPANYALHVSIDAQDPAVHQGLHNKQLEGVDRPVDKFGLFLKSGSAIAGPSEGIRIHWPDRRNDHEVELALVIGKGGKNISTERALDHVAGYLVGIDVTVRGTEDRSYRKAADSYALLGPWLTTADEIDDPMNLEFWLDVNGERRQKSSSAAMTVPIPELIAMASRVYELFPGDVLMTGTPEGVSEIRAGDTLRAGCEKIGEMTFGVANAATDNEAAAA